MADKVKLSKDGSSIDFVQTDSLPTSMKKFRQSPEIEGFYRFIFENDLQKEAYEILDRIIIERKRKRSEEKAKEKAAAKEASQKEKQAEKATKALSKHAESKKTPPAPVAKAKVAAKAPPAPVKKAVAAKPAPKGKPAPATKAKAKKK